MGVFVRAKNVLFLRYFYIRFMLVTIVIFRLLFDFILFCRYRMNMEKNAKKMKNAPSLHFPFSLLSDSGYPILPPPLLHHSHPHHHLLSLSLCLTQLSTPLFNRSPSSTIKCQHITAFNTSIDTYVPIPASTAQTNQGLKLKGS